MGDRLKDKIAVVSGAGSGIGRAIALLFASEGAKIVCADVSGQEEAVAAEIGAAAVAVHVDVAREDDVARMIATAEQAFGRLDVLVNNAGITGRLARLHEQTSEDWDRVHAINLKGVFLGMKYGLASMLRTGGGSIVNTASTAGLMGMKRLSVYCASKGGVIQLTKAAAADYATDNIRINALCPGNTWTGMIHGPQETPPPPPPPPPGAVLTPGTPMNRWAAPRELAAAALFLASDEASFITGAALPVDGGFTIGDPGLTASQADG